TRLKGMVGERLRLLKESISLRRKGTAPEAVVASLTRGQHRMDDIRRVVAEMRQEEHDLLRDRERRTGNTYRVAVTGGLLTGLVGLVAVGLLVWLVRRSLLARQRDIAERKQAEERKRAEEELRRATQAAVAAHRVVDSVLRNLADGVVVADAAGRFTHFNIA